MRGVRSHPVERYNGALTEAAGKREPNCWDAKTLGWCSAARF